MFPKPFLLVSVIQVTLFLRSAEAGIRPLDRNGRNIYARGFDHSARGTSIDDGGADPPSNEPNTDDDCGNGCPEPIGNFGSCTVPEIEFGQGFDGRKETSFRAVDQSKSTGSFARRISRTLTCPVNLRILPPRFG